MSRVPDDHFRVNNTQNPSTAAPATPRHDPASLPTPDAFPTSLQRLVIEQPSQHQRNSFNFVSTSSAVNSIVNSRVHEPQTTSETRWAPHQLLHASQTSLQRLAHAHEAARPSTSCCCTICFNINSTRSPTPSSTCAQPQPRSLPHPRAHNLVYNQLHQH